MTPAISRRAEIVLSAIADDTELLVRRVVEAVIAAVPAYGELISGIDLHGDILKQVHGLMKGDVVGDRITGDWLKIIEVVGARRAEAGVSLDDMLRGWNVALKVVLQHARVVGERMGLNADEAADVFDILLGTSDEAMVVLARAHRSAELELVRRAAEDRTAVVTGLLTGVTGVAARGQASTVGLDPARKYVAVRVGASDPARLRQVQGTLAARPEQRGITGAVVPLDGDLGAILPSPPTGVDGVTIGVGPPRYADRLHESFQLATRALHTAQALGLSGTHAFDELALEAAVVSDAPVGISMYRKYVEPLGGGAGAREIRATVEAYFATGLSVDRTAGLLNVHPNTVRYRLSRFEEQVGAKLRDPRTLFGVWWGLTATTIADRRAQSG